LERELPFQCPVTDTARQISNGEKLLQSLLEKFRSISGLDRGRRLLLIMALDE
jgi:hypothetical protein